MRPILTRRREWSIAGFGEMRVQSQGVTQALDAHELEADAVDEAQPPPILADQPLHAPPMERFRYPLDGEDGHDVLVEITNGGKTDAVLQEGDRLDQDV